VFGRTALHGHQTIFAQAKIQMKFMHRKLKASTPLAYCASSRSALMA
jgi:hypothetical protein